jgi:hypothetical protein
MQLQQQMIATVEMKKKLNDSIERSQIAMIQTTITKRPTSLRKMTLSSKWKIVMKNHPRKITMEMPSLVSLNKLLYGNNNVELTYNGI